MSDVPRKTFRFEAGDLEEGALQTQILLRCRRSIDHDLKNAVQALHSGLDVLSRTLQAPSRKISPLECIPLLQQQLASLQQKLGGLLDEVAPEPAMPAAFDLVQLLDDLLRFLNYERAVAQARRQLPPEASVLARKSVIRRVLLGCILDALDTEGSLQFAIVPGDSAVTLELRVVAPSRLTVDAAPPARQQLRRILERAMAGENSSLVFADTDDGHAMTVRLPKAVTETAAPPASPPSDEETTGDTRAAPNAVRVLIVDDNRDAADSLALLLELEGQDAKAVYTGEQALALIDEYQPALVLLDIGLPDMSGDVVAVRIRESSRCQPLLVSVSGYDRGARRAAAAPFSFDAELVKPVELPALRKLLAKLPAQ